MTSEEQQQQQSTNPNAKEELNQNDLNQIKDIAQKILNPNNNNPTMNEYIQSTFAYIGTALMKMQTTNDKQATAKEIADDLTQRFETWVQNREAEQKKQQEAVTTEDKPAITDKKE
ncbi:predicted protein [Candida tropicalis MYA-3404]|uniref:Uncharacterized protein n=1 Tax=Candida tropicalis (strain ATCC MYA-3404 / T1) TaxID=294747 RepID=C5MHQ2_CANTT|nr:predicted protein [Candida tropicalis MYA-3404]EER30599.1 predicted protein [Candida tropicalis MYA-3404]KAG4409332.1 hypothetical protein JTP64_002638 [Candida tropicalis]MCP8717963.1 hypothetical protein [Asgard group archaeon]